MSSTYEADRYELDPRTVGYLVSYKKAVELTVQALAVRPLVDRFRPQQVLGVSLLQTVLQNDVGDRIKVIMAARAKAKKMAVKGVKGKTAGVGAKGATAAKTAYAKGGMVKTVADQAASGAVDRIMTPREKEDTTATGGNINIKKIM